MTLCTYKLLPNDILGRLTLGALKVLNKLTCSYIAQSSARASVVDVTRTLLAFRAIRPGRATNCEKNMHKLKVPSQNEERPLL